MKMERGGGVWACTASIHVAVLFIQAIPWEVLEMELTRPFIMSRFRTA